METTESAGSGDDEQGSSKLGSQALPTAAAPTQREKEYIAFCQPLSF